MDDERTIWAPLEGGGESKESIPVTDAMDDDGKLELLGNL